MRSSRATLNQSPPSYLQNTMPSDVIDIPMTEEVTKAHGSNIEKVLEESGVIVHELDSDSYPVIAPAAGKWAAIKADRRAFAWSLYILL